MRAQRGWPCLGVALAACCLAALACPGPAQVPAREDAAPSGQNAALLYWQAHAAAELPVATDDLQLALLVDNVSAGDAPYDPVLLEPVVARNASALALLERAVVLDRCDFGTGSAPDSNTMPTKHYGALRSLVTLSRLVARRDAALSQWPKAAARDLAIVRMARHLDADHLLISSLLAQSTAIRAIRDFAQLVESAPADEALLLALWSGLSGVPDQPIDLSAAIERERSLHRATFAGYDAERWIDGIDQIDSIAGAIGAIFEPLAPPSSGAGERDAPSVADTLRRCVTSKDATDEERAALAKALVVEPGDLAGPGAFTAVMARKVVEVDGLLARLSAVSRVPYPARAGVIAAVKKNSERLRMGLGALPTSAAGAFEEVTRLEATIAAARVFVLARIAEARTGRRPPSLEEIVRGAGSLPRAAIPADPYSGEPFTLVSEGAEVRLISKGRDEKDGARPLTFSLRWQERPAAPR